MIRFLRVAVCAVSISLGVFPLRAIGQQDSAATTLKPVVVTVTRGSGRTILGSPFAITISEPDSSRPGQRHSAVDETLAMIPGVMAVNRTNPAQDPRLSIRGFGARSAFGVRSVRVLRDGMPITLPDGQTPLDYVSLESVGRVEVLRGAASALYGNAGGGVVDLRSASVPPRSLALEAKQWVGSSAISRSVLSAAGSAGDATYVGDIAYSRSDGPRAHSTQRATTGFARVSAGSGANQLSLLAMALVNPLAENPGALTYDEMQADTRMADALSVRRNARKSVNQIQLGISAERSTARTQLSLSAFGGARSLDNPLTFAVVEVGRHTWGASASLKSRRALLGTFQSIAAGFDVQSQNDLRRNFAACADTIPAGTPTATCPLPGNDRGIVTLDQRELVTSAGAYLSDEIPIQKYISITAGIRADRIRFEVQDRLITGSNPDDSGDRSLGAVSPVAGVVARIAPAHSVYANVSTAFETPTATELGNHEDGTAGINANLDPQKSVTAETGVKGWFGPAVRYDLSIYRTKVNDELIPFEIPSSNGRRYFRNAGRTTRKGVELGVDVSVQPLTLMLAYTWSRFRFDEYLVSGVEFTGNTIPGVPPHRVQTAVRLTRDVGFLLIENETASKTWLDDANTVQAPFYSVTSFRAGWRPHGVASYLSITTGLQNVFNRVYASSFAVNAARSKYFEPAHPRSLYVGLSIGVRRAK